MKPPRRWPRLVLPALAFAAGAAGGYLTGIAVGERRTRVIEIRIEAAPPGRPPPPAIEPFPT